MVDFRGKCGRCKKNTTAINPGLICAVCQLSYHSDCLTPPVNIYEMKSLAVTDPQWLCKKCTKDHVADKTRKREEIVDLSKRMDMIIEVRELLELAELALDQLEEKHENLVKLNKFLKHENLILSRRLSYLDKGYKFKEELLQQLMQKRKSTVRVPEDISAPGKKDGKKEDEDEVTKDFTTFAKYAGLNAGERTAFKMQGRLKKLSKTWFTHLCLFLCVIIYTCIGAGIFHVLERGTPQEEPDKKEDLVQKHSKQILNGSDSSMADFEKGVRDRLTWENKVERGQDEMDWGFYSSVFFCGTVYTTIGYGHMYPVTDWGKVAVIIYATIGVPLFLLALADFGTALTRSIKYLWNRLRRCVKKRKNSKGELNETPEDVNLPVTLALSIELIYLLIGSALFIVWEDWNFLDSFYFVFQSIATIGYGDFVPKNQLYLIFGMLYILLGLALSSMVINVVREKMIETMNKTSAKLGKTLETYVEELTSELAKKEIEDQKKVPRK